MTDHGHYRVKGTAHGEQFDAWGFHTEKAATDYASAIIDGDIDSDVEVLAPPDAAAIARADRQLRRELEAITDPKLRKECLDAL